MSPEEELRTLVSGGEVKPVPGMDIAGHLQAHQAQLAQPLIRQIPDLPQKLQRLIQQETQLLQAQQFAQLLQQQQGGRPQNGANGTQAGNAQKGQAAAQPNAVAPPQQTNLNPIGTPNAQSGPR